MHFLYRITDTLNNKIYIGKSNNPSRRWTHHKNQAKKEKPIQYIHRAIAKYGVENFIFEVIATCKTQEDAEETEIQLIVQYNSRDKHFGYNVSPGGDGIKAGLPPHMYPMYGKKQSEHQKQRMSEVHAGKIMSEESRAKMAASAKTRAPNRKGEKHSEESKRKMSDTKRGRKLSEETKQKMAEARKRYWNNKG